MLVVTHDLERVRWIGRGRGKAPLREKEERNFAYKSLDRERHSENEMFWA